MKLLNRLPFSLFLLITVFFGTFSLGASDQLSGDFSGQPLGKVLAEIAKVGKMNVVGDFSNQQVPCAQFHEAVYYEEAFNLVTKSCGMVIRRNDNIWLVLPRGQEKRLEAERGITKFTHNRSPSTLEEPLRPLLYPQMRIWFPPLSGAIAMFGTHEYLEELKKVFETLDVPSAGTHIDLLLQREPDQSPIASASFVTLGWKPFRLTYSTPTPQSETFDVQGLVGINDNGIFHGKYRLEIFANGQRHLFSQEMAGKDQEWINHVFNISGTPMTVSLRGSYVPLRGRILPLSRVAQPPLAQKSTSQENPPQKENMTEIPHAENVTLDKPLIFENAPVAQIIEQLASKEKIPIVCDAAVSGTITVYCYGENVNRIDLISAIAKTKGYDVFPHGNGLIVTEPKAVRDMIIGETPPLVTGSLLALSPASACQALQEGFKAGNITGTVEMKPGNRLQIKADGNGLRLAETLENLWINRLKQFSLGVQVFKARETFSDSQSVSLEKTFSKEWTSAGGAVRISLKPVFVDFTEGLRQIHISLDSKGSNQERWNLQCTTNLPSDPSIPLFNGLGNSPLKILWKAAIASQSAEPDQEQSSLGTATIGAPFDTDF